MNMIFSRKALEGSAYAVVSIGGLIVFWWLAVHHNWVSSFVLPPPTDVVKAILRIVNGYMGTGLWVHFSASMSVVLMGYIIAIFLGVPLGMSMAYLPIVDRIFAPMIMTLRPIPPPAWIPLAILWFGIDHSSKVFVVFVAAIVPCLLNAYEGVRQTSPKLINAAEMLGANRWVVFSEVVLPSALPVVLTGIRISLGNAWATLVAAELVVATAGFGFLIINGYRNFEISIMAAAMFPIALIGAAMNIGFILLEKRLVPWRTEQKN
ncbi:MAG: taurine ABC transporter permease [Rhodospirillaceae bacterium]|jgi:ABC-type nitrate/sulfonate/bicarbonate transport system permease component|nr:taurine ABC transporter permease [Rhodospirillaceae bacterium]